MEHFHDGRDWFFKKRYGLFIHWGAYAAGGLHEQEAWRYGTPWPEYRARALRFNPAGFDPAEWLDLAQRNGMEYLIFTAKHHDGFCMWDTAETDFNIVRAAYGKDPLAMLAAECRRRDFPLGIYYSVVDWDRPEYPNRGRHHELATDPARHDPESYLGFLRRQVRELCTRYGKLCSFWFDMNVAEFRDLSVNAMIRELQPGAVINNRGVAPGDFSTPERHFQPSPEHPFATPTEACNSVGFNSWGYRRREDFYSARSLEAQLAVNLALGGNYLLNAGPDGDGRIPTEAAAVLDRIGGWFRRVKPALTAPPCPGAVTVPGIFATGGGNILHLILPGGADVSALRLPPLPDLPRSALLLNTGEPLEATMEPPVWNLADPPVLRLRGIPVERLYAEVPVIRLEFDRPVVPTSAPAPAVPASGPEAGSVARG